MERDLTAFVGAGPRPARPAVGRRWFHRHDPRATPARAGRGPAPTNAAPTVRDSRPSWCAGTAAGVSEESFDGMELERVDTQRRIGERQAAHDDDVVAGRVVVGA